MSKNVCGNVFCPWCGAAMERQGTSSCAGGNVYWWHCYRCNIDSPAKMSLEEADKAAMTRHEEPNRVLTPAELKSYTGFIWCESRDGKVFEPGWVEYMYAYGRGCETINLCDENIDWTQGRCWLRKPTLEEMENTPWEGEDER